MKDKTKIEKQQTIWLDKHLREIYVGERPLDNLMPLERSLLIYLLHHPRIYLTKTELIENVWPDVARDGVSDGALYQLVRSTRRKLESFNDSSYIVNWRGIPEGGYRFFPSGVLADRQSS